jgi:aminoglycoside 6-adenylyltransferase
VGSGAREDHPADEWSDIDLVLVSSQAPSLLSSTGWLGVIGTPLFIITEKSPSGEVIERRALFEGGYDVDLIIVSPENARAGFPGNFVNQIAVRGVRVLFDKDAVLASLPMQVRTGHTRQPPSAADFSEAVNDFWFHAVWTAKKLRRGELWVAKSCCDTYMKRILLRMVEWHAIVTREGAIDTWFEGRFLEQWASPMVLKELKKAFAHYDDSDVWSALTASMGLFHRIAAETAAHLRHDYPAETAKKVSDLVQTYGFPEGRS